MGHSSGYRDFFAKKNDFWIQSNLGFTRALKDPT